MRHIYHHKFPPSSDVWLCFHGTGYPDICEYCRADSLLLAAKVLGGVVSLENLGISQLVKEKQNDAT